LRCNTKEAEREKSFSSHCVHSELASLSSFLYFEYLAGKNSQASGQKNQCAENIRPAWFRIAKSRGGCARKYSAPPARCFQTRERGHVEFINRALGKCSSSTLAAAALMGLVNFCRCQTTPHEFFMILQLTDRKSIYTVRGFSFGCWTGA
jgi:hypothetical protein